MPITTFHHSVRARGFAPPREDSSPNVCDSKAGEWLSERGPYLDLIKRLCVSDPSLRRPERKNRSLENPLAPGNARVACLELRAGPSVQRRDFAGAPGANELRKYLRDAAPSPGAGCGRLYIMEGLAKDYVGILGSHLNPPPAVFAFQDRNHIWALARGAHPDTAALPSLLDREAGFRIKYFEVLRSTTGLATFRERCARTGRHVGSILLEGQQADAFTVRRKCAFWSRQHDDGGWDGLILCDPPLERTMTKGLKIETPIETIPWQGGYPDILRSATDPSLPGPPRTCLLDDLCYYFEHHPHLLPSCGDPHAATLFLKKIVACQYKVLANFNRALISEQEFSLAHQEDMQGFSTELVEHQWSELQAFSRRCSEQLEDLEDAMLAFRIPLQDPDAAAAFAWSDCGPDYQFLRMRLRSLKARAAALINSMTAAASMTGNRQAVREARRALKETKNAKALALVGLIFIPLAYSSSLFSMSEAFVPGSGGFWVYWAVAIPLMVAVFGIALLYQLGLDQDSTWRYEVYLKWIIDRNPIFCRRWQG